MAKTRSPKRASLKTSPFTAEQVTWVILKYGELRQVRAVQRAFATNFYRKKYREDQYAQVKHLRTRRRKKNN